MHRHGGYRDAREHRLLGDLVVQHQLLGVGVHGDRLRFGLHRRVPGRQQRHRDRHDHDLSVTMWRLTLVMFVSACWSNPPAEQPSAPKRAAAKQAPARLVIAAVTLDGKPVEQFDVTIVGAGSPPVVIHGGGGSFDQVVTPTDVFSAVRAGRFDIAITGDFARHVIERVPLGPNVTTYLGEIDLRHGETIEGHVVDTSGAPIPDADVYVTYDATPGRRAAVSNSDGFFRIEGVTDAARVYAVVDGTIIDLVVQPTRP